MTVDLMIHERKGKHRYDRIWGLWVEGGVGLLMRWTNFPCMATTTLTLRDSISKYGKRNSISVMYLGYRRTSESEILYSKGMNIMEVHNLLPTLESMSVPHGGYKFPEKRSTFLKHVHSL